MTKVTNIKAKAISVAGGFTLLQDVAQPIAPFAAYVAGISAISTLILLLVHLFYKAGENLKTAWLLSAATFVLSTGLWGVQQYFDANESGLLASSTPVVANFQQAIGIAKSIQADTHAIKESTHSIDQKMGNVKKEISAIPKIALQNMGVTWKLKSFKEAIINGDIETLQLFIKGGFEANLYGGTNQNFFISFVHDSTAVNFDRVVKYLASKELIIPNKGLRIYMMGTFANPMGDIPYIKVRRRYGSYQSELMQESKIKYRKRLTLYQEKVRRYRKKGKDYHQIPLPAMESRVLELQYLSMVNLLTLAVWDGSVEKVKTLLSIGEKPNFSGILDLGINNSGVISPITEAKLFGENKIERLLH